ncbi:MAG: phage tail tape measure protein [Clostridium sp.]|nr:phage tail tape measure protein [Clostridium sp.]
MGSKADVIEKLAVELSLEANDFKKKITAINSIIRNSEKDFKSAGKGVKDFENTFKGLDAKIQKTTKQLELYNLKLVKQKEEYEKNKKIVEEQTQKLNKLEETLGKNSKEWQEQAKLVQKNSQYLSKLGSDIRDTESNINKLSKELKESQDKFDNLGKSTKSIEEKLKSIDNNAKLTESTFNKLGSELDQSGNYFKRIGNEINQLTFKVDTAVQKTIVYEEAINKTNTILSKNRDEHNKLGKEIKDAENKLSQAKNEFGENSDEAKKLKQGLLELKDQYMSLEREIDDNKKSLDEYQTELNNAQVEVKELTQELKNMPFDKIGGDLKELGNKTRSIGQGLTAGVTVPITGAGIAATVAGTNFSTTMSTLQATADISDKTSDSFKALEKKALEMGSSTSFSASEAAEGLTFLSLAGWDVETSIDRIEPVLRAAEAGAMDLGLAADLITDSMSAAGVASKDFTKYLDISAQAQRKSNQTMQQLYEANIVAGGSFKMLNIPMEKSGALLGVLANRGIKGSEAGKALSSVFANLVTETGQAGDALTAMNISLFDGEGKQRDMIEVLKELRSKLINTADGTSNLTEQQQVQYAAMIGGKTQFDTLMALLDGLGGEYDNLVVHLENSNGSLEEMARIMKDNLGGEVESMKSALEGALIRAFVALEPVISKVVELITEAANWFSNLDSEQQKTIVTILGVVAAIGPLLTGIGQLIIVGGNAVTLLGGLSSSTGMLSGAIGVLSGPVGIGALIVVLGLLITCLGDSESALLTLQEKFGGLGFIIGGVCEYISGIVQLTFGNLGIAIMGICDMIAAIADGPGGLTVNEAWSKMTNKMTLNTEEAMGKIALTTTRGMSQMLNATEESLTQLTTVMDATLGVVPGIVEGNYSEAGRILGNQLASMDTNQLTILQGMNDTTKMMFQGIRQGMTVDEAANQVEWNLKQMSKAGKINGDSMSKDITSAMEQLNKQLSTKTGDASKEVSKNMDKAEKDSVKSAKSMEEKTSSSARKMEQNTSKSARDMKNSVTSSTSQMANQAINDWSRLRNYYSNPIYGNVSVTRKVRENVSRSVSEPLNSINENSRIISNLGVKERLNVSRYITRGSYYNHNSSNRAGVVEQSRNITKVFEEIFKKLESLKLGLEDSKEKMKIEIPIYLDKELIRRAVYPTISNELAIKKRGRR